jgi:hypothetical protein
MFTERGYYGRRVLARDFEKHRKASMALDERRDVRVVCSGEKISCPVAWHGARSITSEHSRACYFSKAVKFSRATLPSVSTTVLMSEFSDRYLWY